MTTKAKSCRCGTFISPGDAHFQCIMHRRCNRNKPCDLDRNKGAEYWDNIDSILLSCQDSPACTAQETSASGVSGSEIATIVSGETSSSIVSASRPSTHGRDAKTQDESVGQEISSISDNTGQIHPEWGQAAENPHLTAGEGRQTDSRHSIADNRSVPPPTYQPNTLEVGQLLSRFPALQGGFGSNLARVGVDRGGSPANRVTPGLAHHQANQPIQRQPTAANPQIITPRADESINSSQADRNTLWAAFCGFLDSQNGVSDNSHSYTDSRRDVDSGDDEYSIADTEDNSSNVSTLPDNVRKTAVPDCGWELEDDPTLSLFPSSRVEPIVEYMASNMGLSVETAEEVSTPQGSFFFNSFDQRKKKSSPTVSLPSEVFDEMTRIEKMDKTTLAREAKREQVEIANAFPVGAQDALDCFTVSDIDKDILSYMKAGPKSRDAFNKAKEEELRDMQREWIHVKRIGIFQMSLLNSLSFDLRPPVEESNDTLFQRSFCTARLAMDMAGRAVRAAARSHHRLEVLRRQNALASVRPFVVSSLVDALTDAPFGVDRSRLFGGVARKTAKSVSKQKIADDSIQKAVRKPNLSFRQSSRPHWEPRQQPDSRRQSSRAPRRGGGASQARGGRRRSDTELPRTRSERDWPRSDRDAARHSFKKPRSSVRGRGRRGL